MSRRKAREIALQALFQFDFTKNDDENLIEMLIKETKGLNQQSILFTREISTKYTAFPVNKKNKQRTHPLLN